jgi:hypothetical protein
MHAQGMWVAFGVAAVFIGATYYLASPPTTAASATRSSQRMHASRAPAAHTVNGSRRGTETGLRSDGHRA